MFRIVGPNGEPGGGLVVVLIASVLAMTGFFIIISQAFSSVNVI